MCVTGDRMLLTLMTITVAMLGALGVALYLAYRETEADFPLRHKPHRGKDVERDVAPRELRSYLIR